MKKLENKQKTLLFSLVALLGVLGFSLATATTLAAYLNISKNNFETNYKTEDIGSKYFASGTGTSGDPYLLTSADHLRNLQKLTSLGLFSSSTCFRLNSDITWSGEALLPIGSDDMPFEGVFDGYNHTISNLVVDGNNTWDIGMFGYCAITSTIKNFFLSAPTINVGANTSNSGSADTTNPLANYLRTPAASLATPFNGSAQSGSLTWTNSSSSATIAGLDSTITCDLGTFNITWESSNTTLLSNDNGTWTTHANSASTNPTHDLYPVDLTGRVFSTLDNQVIAYTVERYQFNILGDGTIDKTGLTVDGSVTTTPKNVFKTIWPTGDTHGTYVGFFIGHTDGLADHLGLVGGNSSSDTTNGKIVVSGRVASSKTCLIGRSREDNTNDASTGNKYNKYFDFTKDVTWSNNCGTAAVTGIANGNLYTSSTDFSSQQTKANTLTTTYLGSDFDTTYLKLFPSANKLTTTSYNYYDSNGDVKSKDNVTSFQLTEPIAAGNWSEYTHVGLSWAGANYHLIRNFYVNNGLWIWATANASDRLTSIFNESIFYITFKISYVATTTSQTHEQNSFQILYNLYNPNITSYYWVAWSYNDAHMKLARWYDLHHPVTWDSSSKTYVASSNTGTYVPTDHKINDDGYLHDETITLVVNKSDENGFFYNLVNYWFSSDIYYPCFALGMGTNQKDTPLVQNAKGTISYDSGKALEQFSNSDTSSDYSNCYMPLEGDTKLDILSLEVLFSNREGNVASLMNCVDYMYDTNCTWDSSTDTFTTWNSDSGTKVYFDVTTALTTGNAAYYFYRSNSSPYTVTANYSNSDYACANTENYKAATIATR